MSRADGPELVVNAAAPGFAAEYETGNPALARFYTGHPRDGAAYDRKAAQVAAAFDAGKRRGLTSMLRPLNDEAKGRLAAVARGNGFVVTTGQQAGILGGPLYTIYKALSAVALADALQERLGVPVLPVFWVASEDHDWAEVSHVDLLDTANRLHRIELPDPLGGGGGAGPGPAMARRRFDDGIARFIEDVRALLPPTEFRDALLERVAAAYSPGTSVGDAFERLLAEFLASVPLAMIQASDPELKRASIPILRAELEHGERHEALLIARTEELAATGHEPQVPIATGAENVFYESDVGRERLVRTEDGWITRGRGVRMTRDEALAQLEAEPWRFSPNVLLRPVVESAVLPTLAYVGGPAEVRYFAQTGCLFAAHGVGMPIVVPRASRTVVEAKTRKVLDKFELAVDDLAVPEQELAARVLAESMPQEVDAAIKRLRGAIGEGYASLADAVKQIDPTLKGPIGTARSDAFKTLGDIEQRVMRGLKAQNEIALEQIAKARANLYPSGKPQERVLNPLQYLVRYGDGFVAQVRASIGIDLAQAFPSWTGVECP